MIAEDLKAKGITEAPRVRSLRDAVATTTTTG
jgi:hypothetical protein